MLQRVSWRFSYWECCFCVNGGRECSASALKAETVRVRRKKAHSSSFLCVVRVTTKLPFSDWFALLLLTQNARLSRVRRVPDVASTTWCLPCFPEMLDAVIGRFHADITSCLLC